MARMPLGAAVLVFCGSVFIEPASAEFGHASWYAMTTRTASGESCDPSALAAAHRSLPFGTRVRVENHRNGRWVVVRINDRGPYARGRIIDVTRAAARHLDFLSSGTTKVRLTVMPGESVASSPRPHERRTPEP